MNWLTRHLKSLIFALKDGKARNPVLGGLKEGDNLIMELRSAEVGAEVLPEAVPCLLLARVDQKYATRVVVEITHIDYPTLNKTFSTFAKKIVTAKEADRVISWTFLGSGGTNATKELLRAIR